MTEQTQQVEKPAVVDATKGSAPAATAPATQTQQTEPTVPTVVTPTVVQPARDEFKVDVRELTTTFFNPVVWEQMKGMATTFASSGALSKDDNAARLVMKIQAGYEMGMKPVESIKSFYFVNGVLNIFGAAVIRRLREHGWHIEYKDELDKCTATITKGDESYTDSLTFAEAEASGWTKSSYGLKPGWLAGINRKLKLRYGVTSSIIKTYVPDVLGSAVDIAEVAMDTVPLYETPALQPTADDDEPATDAQKATAKGIADKKGLEVDIEHLTKGQFKKIVVETTTKKPRK